MSPRGAHHVEEVKSSSSEESLTFSKDLYEMTPVAKRLRGNQRKRHRAEQVDLTKEENENSPIKRPWWERRNRERSARRSRGTSEGAHGTRLSAQQPSSPPRRPYDREGSHQGHGRTDWSSGYSQPPPPPPPPPASQRPYNRFAANCVGREGPSQWGRQRGWNAENKEDKILGRRYRKNEDEMRQSSGGNLQEGLPKVGYSFVGKQEVNPGPICQTQMAVAEDEIPRRRRRGPETLPKRTPEKKVLGAGNWAESRGSASTAGTSEITWRTSSPSGAAGDALAMPKNGGVGQGKRKKPTKRSREWVKRAKIEGSEVVSRGEDRQMAGSASNGNGAARENKADMEKAGRGGLDIGGQVKAIEGDRGGEFSSPSTRRSSASSSSTSASLCNKVQGAEDKPREFEGKQCGKRKRNRPKRKPQRQKADGARDEIDSDWEWQRPEDNKDEETYLRNGVPIEAERECPVRGCHETLPASGMDNHVLARHQGSSHAAEIRRKYEVARAFEERKSRPSTERPKIAGVFCPTPLVGVLLARGTTTSVPVNYHLHREIEKALEEEEGGVAVPSQQWTLARLCASLICSCRIERIGKMRERSLGDLLTRTYQPIMEKLPRADRNGEVEPIRKAMCEAYKRRSISLEERATVLLLWRYSQKFVQ